jgi:hypothetical protein
LYEHRDWLKAKVDAGVCELTGTPFDFSGRKGNPYAPSLDRIDSSKGYTRDNVRLVCFGLNAAMNVWGIGPIERMMVHRRRLKDPPRPHRQRPPIPQESPIMKGCNTLTLCPAQMHEAVEFWLKNQVLRAEHAASVEVVKVCRKADGARRYFEIELREKEVPQTAQETVPRQAVWPEGAVPLKTRGQIWL